MDPAPSSGPSLPRTVRALGWTSFLTDLSSEAIYPLLPGFITRDLGGSALAVGLIDGIANAVAAVMRLPAGALSDAVGRRPLVILGYGLSALFRPLMALVGTPAGVLAVRAADRFGKGIRSAPRDALVSDLVEPALRGRAFGHIRGMDHLGAALGPLVAMAFLLAWPGRERTLFLLSIVPGLVTLGVIRAFVHDPPRASRPAAASALAGGLTRSQGMLLVAVAVWALGAASEQFLLLRAADMGVQPGLVPAVWFAVGLVKSAMAHGAGRIIDRIAARGALAAGWLLFAVAHSGLAVAGALPTTLLSIGLVAAAHGLIEPAERALVAQLAPPGRVGAGFGWYALVQGLMAVPAGLLAGWLWKHHGAGHAFAGTAVLATIACGILLMAIHPATMTPPGDPR